MNTEKTNGESTPPAITSFSPARSGASSPGPHRRSYVRGRSETLARAVGSLGGTEGAVPDNPDDDIVGEAEPTALLARLDAARIDIGGNDDPARHRSRDVEGAPRPYSPIRYLSEKRRSSKRDKTSKS